MSVLLLDLGAAAAPLPNLEPVAPAYGRWAPVVYEFPVVPVPGSFAAIALADAVLLTWAAVPRASYVIERALDVAGVAGAWVEIERTSALAIGFPVASGTAYWWRVRAVVFGRSSARTAAILRAPNDMNASLGNLASNLATVSGVADAAQAAAAASLAALADIANDDLLTPDEKPSVMRDVAVIAAEQAGIDSEADDYRIVVEKATYDDAITALTDYLDTLTTPVAWDDLGGNTDIDGAEFREMFAAVYTARQALFNAITATIKGRVDAASGPNLAVNYTFFGTTGWWGEAGGYNGNMAGSVVDGYLRATVPSGWVGNFDLYEHHWFEVSAGDVFFLSAMLSAFSNTHASNIGLAFKDAAGTLTWAVAASVAAGVAGTPVNGTITAPAGVLQACLWASVIGPAAGDRISFRDVYCERSLLYKPGSGAQLGDARNQPMVTVGNFGSAWSGLSVTWTTTTTSATLTASAATLQVGSAAISYNSASVTVSGSAGSTISFYLYYDDPAYAGGAKTLNATTTYINSINSNGRVYVAEVKVTFPTSGTGGGSGGGGTCVSVDMLVIERASGVMRASEVRAGDWLLRGDGEFGRVTFSDRSETAGVRIVCDDFGWLDCSTSAPIQTDEGFALAPDMLGRVTPRWRMEAGELDKAGDALVIDVARLGIIAVQHITLDPNGNASELARVFLASADGVRWWAHHNIKKDIPL